MIYRRSFVVALYLSFLTDPTTSFAQTAEKVYRIAFARRARSSRWSRAEDPVGTP